MALVVFLTRLMTETIVEQHFSHGSLVCSAGVGEATGGREESGGGGEAGEGGGGRGETGAVQGAHAQGRGDCAVERKDGPCPNGKKQSHQPV